METTEKAKAFNTSVYKQIDYLKTTEYKNAVIVSNKVLARLLDVDEQTIINWRDAGWIRGQLIAPRVWRYKMPEVIADIEKYRKVY